MATSLVSQKKEAKSSAICIDRSITLQRLTQSQQEFILFDQKKIFWMRHERRKMLFPGSIMDAFFISKNMRLRKAGSSSFKKFLEATFFHLKRDGDTFVIRFLQKTNHYCIISVTNQFGKKCGDGSSGNRIFSGKLPTPKGKRKEDMGKERCIFLPIHSEAMNDEELAKCMHERPFKVSEKDKLRLQVHESLQQWSFRRDNFVNFS